METLPHIIEMTVRPDYVRLLMLALGSTVQMYDTLLNYTEGNPQSSHLWSVFWFNEFTPILGTSVLCDVHLNLLRPRTARYVDSNLPNVGDVNCSSL